MKLLLSTTVMSAVIFGLSLILSGTAYACPFCVSGNKDVWGALFIGGGFLVIVTFSVLAGLFFVIYRFIKNKPPH
jgi:hypothetical protein